MTVRAESDTDDALRMSDPVAHQAAAFVLQRRTVPSPQPEATVWPSGLNATLQTRSGWPKRLVKSLPVMVSQSRTVLSLPLEASVRPSGLKATAATAPSCPLEWPGAVGCPFPRAGWSCRLNLRPRSDRPG